MRKLSGVRTPSGPAKIHQLHSDGTVTVRKRKKLAGTSDGTYRETSYTFYPNLPRNSMMPNAPSYMPRARAKSIAIRAALVGGGDELTNLWAPEWREAVKRAKRDERATREADHV